MTSASCPWIACVHCGVEYRSNIYARHEQTCWTPRTFDRLMRISGADTSDPDACWEWRTMFGGKTLQYPRLGGKRFHRLVCELVYGPPPPGRTHTLHSCDNVLCGNPRHLRWGTHSDNMTDRWARTGLRKVTGGEVR